MSTGPHAQTGAVFGRYVLVEPIGSGAMGEVWVAVDPDLDRKVALKLLRPTRSSVQDNPRLIREARAMARLNHPNVVVVHDVGEVDGRVFIAMEFVDGESLSEFIARGPHPWLRVLPLLRQAGAGLAAAHAAGIVHRDLKPANVLIGNEGRVRVLDFGLAAANSRARPKELGAALVPPATEDRNEAAVGTPAYMASEQHRGESFDARSDQFAFCVTAFEALYGRRPFPGEHRYAVALAIVEGRLDDVPAEQQAPAWIHRTLLRGMSREPEARFPDMAALLDELARDPIQRRRRWLLAGSALALAAAGVGAWSLRSAPPDPCADANPAMDLTWTDERRAALGQWLRVGPAPEPQRALRPAPEAWREQASERVLEGLDSYALDWQAAQHSVCSERVAKLTTDRLIAARELCLDQNQHAVDTLARLPERGHDESAEVREHVLARPYALLRALGRPQRCADWIELDQPDQPAPVHEQALAVARAQLWLAIDLPELAGREIASFPCPSAAEASCAPALALTHARILVHAGETDQAAALLERVATRSLRADPSTTVRAWLELATLERPEARSSAAIEWLGYADALADDRLPRTSRIEVALVGARLDLAGAQPELARARLDAALLLAHEDPPLDPDLEAELLRTRAQALERSGRPELARADELRARELLELALGVGHPASSPW